MGSTDKIMVALVALEQVKRGKASLEDEVTISEDTAAFATPLYSNVALVVGDVLSVRWLLAAILSPPAPTPPTPWPSTSAVEGAKPA